MAADDPKDSATPVGGGNSIIDPTKNVEDLVRAAEVTSEKLRTADSRFIDAQLAANTSLQNFAREAESKLQNFAREAEARLQNALREAETRRIDQLAENRQEFQNTIRDMLAESVRTTSTLVSTQLVQIQATFDLRVTRLETAQLTQAGRSSVADPALQDALTRINNKLAGLEIDYNAALARITTTVGAIQTADSGVAGTRRGMTDSNARLLSVVMAVAAVASPVIAILVTIMAMRGH